MKVKELIEQLKMVNQEAEVILAKDSEGNQFSKLENFDECWANMAIAYDVEMLYEHEKIDKNEAYLNEAVVLWPI